MADTAEQALYKRELEDRSQDIWRVYNPLEIDFKFKYDSRWFTVKAKSTWDKEYYLCRQFFTKISEYIIGQMMIEKGQAMLDERKAKGMVEILNKYDENRQIWDNTPRTDNREILEKLRDEIILGIVEVYGGESAPEEETKMVIPSNESVVDQVFNAANKVLVNKANEEKPLIKPLKSVLEKELTVEDKK
jgi:hypothetical protein